MSDSNLAAIVSPKQLLKKLSFCKANTKSLEQWLHTLNQADALAVADSLALAIDEICQLQCKDKLRLELLELIQNQAHTLFEQLEKRHLGLLTHNADKAKKTLDARISLQQNLAIGFTVCAKIAAQNMQRLFNKPSATFDKATLLALQETRISLLSSYQQHQFKLDALWQRSHALYQLYQQHQTGEQHRSVQAAYKHLLLWGCTNAHQINQQDFRKLDSVLAIWQDRVGLVLQPCHQKYAYFVDENLASAPIAERLFKGKAALALNLSALVAYLKQANASQDLASAQLSNRTLPILLHSWGASSDRVFERLAKQADLHYVTGLRACHFHLGGQQTLAQQIGQNERTDQKASFSPRKSSSEQLDVWQQSTFGAEYRSEAQSGKGEIAFHVPSNQNENTAATSSTANFPTALAKIIDTSPAGYQLEVKTDKNNNCIIDVGNLLLVKEAHHKYWDLAIIRWLKHDQRSFIGIELFQPNVSACAIAPSTIHAEPTANYLHALLLPDATDSEEGDRIIVPNNMLKQGMWACILTASEKKLIKLNKLLLSNNYFCIFSYEEHKPLRQLTHSEPKNEKNPFSTTWEIL